MPKPWAVGSVAGIPIVDVNGHDIRTMIRNPGALLTGLAASHQPAADGTIWSQVISVGGKGKPFTIEFSWLPVPLFLGIITAIEALIVGSNPSFPIALSDDNGTYSANVMVYGNPYFDFPPQRANGKTIKGPVILSLIGK